MHQKHQEIESTAYCFVFEGFGNYYQLYYQSFESWHVNSKSYINAGRKVEGKSIFWQKIEQGIKNWLVT